MKINTLFFRTIPKIFPMLYILTFSDFEPRIILKSFFNTKGITSPKKLKNIFQSVFLLILYYIIRLSRSLCVASIIQSTSEMSYN